MKQSSDGGKNSSISFLNLKMSTKNEFSNELKLQQNLSNNNMDIKIEEP